MRLHVKHLLSRQKRDLESRIQECVLNIKIWIIVIIIVVYIHFSFSSPHELAGLVIPSHRLRSEAISF